MRTNHRIRYAGPCLVIGLGLFSAIQLVGQTPAVPNPVPPAIALPPAVPVAPTVAVTPPPPKRLILIQPPPRPFQPRPVPGFTPGVGAIPQVTSPVIQPAVPAPPLQPFTALVFDAETKEVTPKPGDAEAHFIFHITNVFTEIVSINSVRTSCGCTVAKLPEQPWRIAPGSSGPIEVTMNLAGKSGMLSKAVTVESSAGVKTLIVKANIPTDAAATAAQGENMNRLRNMQTAMNDRQAVFKNDCASCHVTPGIGKMGKELYTASCGVCHDSPHRAGAVPDLFTLKHPTNADYWKQWITAGKANSMMPAFAKDQGGPLTDEQIVSLVKYLDEAITSKGAAASPTTGVKPEVPGSRVAELPKTP